MKNGGNYHIFFESRQNIKKPYFDYSNCKLLNELPSKKQATKRHFGVHGYFTKQAWNVVAEYIRNFSQPGDLVLDPFGGSGVTAIESIMNNRRAIHIDLNPMSIFMVSSLIATVRLSKFLSALNRVKEKYLKHKPSTKDKIKDALEKYPYPSGMSLPAGSDVKTVEDLFTDKQIAQLAFLKHLIKKEKDDDIRNSLLLAFSSAITKINLTYHSSSSRGNNAGDTSVFRYYRYRIAKENVDLDLLNVFEAKAYNLLSAKKEIFSKINVKDIKKSLMISKGTATNLCQIQDGTIDYIYTDPPYGSKIPYLDLSIMWNAWLDLETSEYERTQEVIEGGMQKKTEEEYINLLKKSIFEMHRVLKNERWLSIAFSHKNFNYWNAIIRNTTEAGFKYVGSVKQNNGQDTFKKRQNPLLYSGHIVMNFIKSNFKKDNKMHTPVDIDSFVIRAIKEIMSKNNVANIEDIAYFLIIKGLELNLLDNLPKNSKNMTEFLLRYCNYDRENKKFHLRN